MCKVVARPVAGVGLCVCTDNGDGTGAIVCKLDEVPRLVAEHEEAQRALGLARGESTPPERCRPAEMRKALTMVEALKNAGIDFVPVPVRDPAHKIALIGQTLAVLDELEEDSEQ